MNIERNIMITEKEGRQIECPFVSNNGPECPICGASPNQVNLDESGRYGHCDECGSKFPLTN